MTSRCTPVQRLVLLLCGTTLRRAHSQQEIVFLAARHAASTRSLLERLNLITLVGHRLLALPIELPPDYAAYLGEVTDAARRHGTMLELITLDVLANLEAAGIPALPLKGSALARRLYGDVGMRSSIDIDVLVSADDVFGAVEAVRRMGWGPVDPIRRRGRARGPQALPELHARLVHATLPSVEVHWRVHWYERRFAADALARAIREHPGSPLRMQPADELSALVLFYARDGFGGLRSPADVATWWSRMSDAVGDRWPADAVAEAYPELAASLSVGSGLLRRLVGVPAPPPVERPMRWWLAAEMANPFLAGPATQLAANAGLVDLMLAPPRDISAGIRRHLVDVVPAHDGSHGDARRDGARIAHALRVARRWVLALIAVGGGALRRCGNRLRR